MIGISSKSNDIIKDLVKFRDQSKFRDDKSLFYVEGERIIKDSPHDLIEKIFVSKDKVNYYKDFLDKFNDNTIYVLDESAFDKVKDTVNSQGIIGLIKYNTIKELNDELIKCCQSCLILDNVSDPGNLGTIIRLAEATNISLIILTNNCCNVYNTKVIRSCMSSIFRTHIYVSENINVDISKFKSNSFKIYATVLTGYSKKFSDIKYNDKTAIILGNEANGISKDLIDASNETIYIPMCGEIESLNVSIAATAVCYEMMRQNNYYET